MVHFCQCLKERNFTVKSESVSRNRKGKWEYLNGSKTGELVRGLVEMFRKWVEVPRIRHGSRQTLETLIDEEALLLAKYLRDERKKWIPRIAIL